MRAARAHGGVVIAVWLGIGAGALADVVPQTLNGPPVQVRPTAAEPGGAIITIDPGAQNPFAGADGNLANSGSSSGDQSGDDGSSASDADGADSSPDTSGSTSTGSGGTGSRALTTLLGTQWGAQIVQVAQALGINPSTLAGTCVIESGCRNVNNGNAVGMFQMFPAAYSQGLQTALAVAPQLSSSVVQGDAGRSDPVTESIAAAGYQMQAVKALQNAGIDNPTFADTRGYYNFGPTYGPQVALANADKLLSDIVPAKSLTANNIAAGTTVGQWRASVAAKVGTAANQPVMM